MGLASWMENPPHHGSIDVADQSHDWFPSLHLFCMDVE